MTTDNKLSTFIETQVPDFLLEEGPILVDFLEAYYEWMEQTGFVVEGTQNILSYRDIDKTLSQYIQYIKDELFADLPESILANKRLIAKHILDLYQTKGAEKSYKLLFRILYNEAIEFAYPGNQILRASDGVWLKEKILRAQNASNPDIIFKFQGQPITGGTSGATAVVESVKKLNLAGLEIFELSISNLTKDFQDQETITASNGTTAIVRGVMTNVSFVDGGAFHFLNDTVTISAAGKIPALAAITQLDDKSAINFFLISGGSGYRANATISIIGGSGVGASFSIDGISNTEIVQLNTDQVGSMANVILNTGPENQSGGQIDDINFTIGANLKSANISSVLAGTLSFINVTVGTISGITLVDPGYDFNTAIPTATIQDTEVFNEGIIDPVLGGFKGNNSRVDVQYANGAIETIEISKVQSGVGYDIGDAVNIINARAGTFDTTGTVSEKGGIFEKDGRFVGTRGFLSADMFLQDNFFFQEFSYVLKVNKALNDYRKIVQKILHPAGTILFGEVTIRNEADFNSLISTEREITITFWDESTMLGAVKAGFIGHANVADQSPALQSYIANTVAQFRFVTVDDLENRKLLTDTNLDFIEGEDTIRAVRLGNTAANVTSTIRAVSSEVAVSMWKSAPFTGNAEIYRVAPVIANSTICPFTAQTGTVAITEASKTLTGTGTTFDVDVSAGQEIILVNNNDELYTIDSITSNTILTMNIAANNSNSGMEFFARGLS